MRTVSKPETPGRTINAPLPNLRAVMALSKISSAGRLMLGA